MCAGFRELKLETQGQRLFCIYVIYTGLRLLKAFLVDGFYELRIDLTDFEGTYTYAHYDSFDIGDFKENYMLKVTGYIGTAGIVHCVKRNKQITRIYS